MYDQLVLGEASHDIAYLYGIVKNERNIEYFIQESSQFPNAINILFKCLNLLDSCESSRHIVSNILCLIYTHCSERLTIEAKQFISNYVSMSEDELDVYRLNAISIYYSEGAKRQKLVPALHNTIHEDSENHSLKRSVEMSENAPSPTAKRQKNIFPARSRARVREVQRENIEKVEQPGKRVRLTN